VRDVAVERPVPPLPIPTATSAPFWSGLQDEVLRIQRCDACGGWVYYPRSHCPSCLSPALTWTEVSGRGRLHSFTVARQPTAPHFADLVPQLLGIVELEEGPRLTTTLVDVDPEDLRVDLEVVPVFDHVDDEHTLLRYRPA
jgi:uncharacterized OB-fold protein